MRLILEQAHGIRAEEPIFPMEMAFGAEGAPPASAEAVEEAKERGALVLGVVNVVGSSIARATDAGVRSGRVGCAVRRPRLRWR